MNPEPAEAVYGTGQDAAKLATYEIQLRVAWRPIRASQRGRVLRKAACQTEPPLQQSFSLVMQLSPMSQPCLHGFTAIRWGPLKTLVISCDTLRQEPCRTSRPEATLTYCFK